MIPHNLIFISIGITVVITVILLLTIKPKNRDRS